MVAAAGLAASYAMLVVLTLVDYGRGNARWRRRALFALGLVPIIGWHELGHPLHGWEVLVLTLWGLLSG